MTTQGGRLGLWLGAVGFLLSACPDDGGPAGSGTGGDDEMPDGSNPGPGGPGCAQQVGGGWTPPILAADDLMAAPQSGALERVVELDGEAPSAATGSRQAGTTGPSSLAGGRGPFGATTAGPHIHERWGESRKLELSYCINSMPGDDAELEESYHKTIRALHSTMAEWERVTGANFVHIVEDDTPAADPHLTVLGDDVIVRPDCAPGTNAYFGVFAFNSVAQGSSNGVPQAWNDPALEPLGGGVLNRALQVDSSIIAAFGDVVLLSVLRHELGHMMGFLHEEVNLPDQVGSGCTTPEPRPLTPPDSASVLGTPECPGLSDADELSHRDRLSAFFLQHTPRSRFESRAPSIGYRYSGAASDGAEILWHTEGSTEGLLWRPQLGGGMISFVDQAFSYSWLTAPPPQGWFPNQSEVVIPLQLTEGSTSFDLLLFGPGPDVGDVAVFNAGIATSAVLWAEDAFAVPVIGRFDGGDLGRDVAFMYRPGTATSTALVASDGAVSVVTDVAQQLSHAYPLAAPYRGSAFPDDIVWLDPQAGIIMTWLLGDGLLEVSQASQVEQGELGLVPGEHIPAIGDFNGDGRADIMWQGVSNTSAGFAEIEDVLWLSESTGTQLAFGLVDKSVGQSFRPFVGDFDGDGIDDIFWQRSWGMTSDGPSAWSTGPSYVWYFDALGGHEARAFVLDGDYSPYVGDFDADGCHDIGWFDAVGDTLLVWRCLPETRDFDCGITLATPPNAAPVGMHWSF